MAVSVAVKGGGDAVVYQTPSGVFFDLLDSSLAPVKLDQLAVAGATPWVDAQTRAAGGFTVDWMANGVIMAEDFSATGAALDLAHKLAGQPKPAPVGFSSNASGSNVALPSGGYVTGESTATGFTIQQYGADGQPSAPAFSLTSPPISGYAAPVLTVLADGGYVAESALNSNYAASLYVERFSSTGTPLGQATLANYGGLLSLTPADYTITGLADGGFVAAWTVDASILGPDQQSGTYVEEFSAAGAGQGVHRLGAAGSTPVIDALANGRYAVAWTDADGTAEHKTFTEAGHALGTTDPSSHGLSSLLGGKTWSQLFAKVETAVADAVSSATHSIGASHTDPPDPPAAPDPAPGANHLAGVLHDIHSAAHGHGLFLEA